MKQNILCVERMDHLGVVAGVIKDLGLIELIDSCLGKDAREEVSYGECIAAMVINGLGFSSSPLSLTPQFFENKALESLFRPGVKASNFNRFKLSRALDASHKYGSEMLFARASARACHIEKVDTRFNALDTTNFGLTGEYNADSDENTISITHGYSKDCRSDLKQATLELMCSHDGGVPIISRSHNGNASDSKIFRERVRLMIKSFKEAEGPKYLIADSKLYDKITADKCLNFIPFITRIPASIKEERDTISKALKGNWDMLDEKNRYQSFEINHYGIGQRWIVVNSEEARERSEKRINKEIERQEEAVKKSLKKLYNLNFACKEDAMRALKDKGTTYLSISCKAIEEVKKYACKGRPVAADPFNLEYRAIGEIIRNDKEIEEAISQNSCFIIGTSIPEAELPAQEVVRAYKEQNNSVEMGFRFLKDPIMFTSSFFLKKPSRIEGLLMVMTLALLVYSIAQRRMRQALEAAKETLPNQIKKDTARPTLRWVFQLLEGIDVVVSKIRGQIDRVFIGITEFRKKILSYFGPTVTKIYKLEMEYAHAISAGL